MSREAICFLFLNIIIFSIVKKCTVPFRGTCFVGLSCAIKCYMYKAIGLFYRKMGNFRIRTSIKVIDTFKHWIYLYEISCNKLNDLSNIFQSMSDNYI